jgi:hypothetical protein
MSVTDTKKPEVPPDVGCIWYVSRDLCEERHRTLNNEIKDMRANTNKIIWFLIAIFVELSFALLMSLFSRVGIG